MRHKQPRKGPGEDVGNRISRDPGNPVGGSFGFTSRRGAVFGPGLMKGYFYLWPGAVLCQDIGKTPCGHHKRIERPERHQEPKPAVWR